MRLRPTLRLCVRDSESGVCRRVLRVAIRRSFDDIELKTSACTDFKSFHVLRRYAGEQKKVRLEEEAATKRIVAFGSSADRYTQFGSHFGVSEEKDNARQQGLSQHEPTTPKAADPKRYLQISITKQKARVAEARERHRKQVDADRLAAKMQLKPTEAAATNVSDNQDLN